MAVTTVLMVEDDSDITELLSLYLASEGYDLRTACNGEEALRILERESISIMLVDVMMPVMNGFDFITNARKISEAPAIVVSARTQIADKTLGLGLGADGYITKPFDPLEVVALVKALLRRCNASERSAIGEGGSLLVVGPLELDTESLSLKAGGESIILTAAETKIMLKFMRNPGRVFTRSQLYEAVNGSPCIGGDESVMVHISNIRAKIEPFTEGAAQIKTVRGLGYRLDE